MKNSTYALIVAVFLLGFFAGLFAAVYKYQAGYKAITEFCAPYNCTTDTECEEEEARRLQKFM